MDGSRHRWARFGTVWLLGGLIVCLGAMAQPEPEPRPLPAKALRIISRVSLPEGQSVPTDIRWASDDSVFVSWYFDGVAEVGLDGTQRRVLMPNARTAFGPWEHYKHLAVSPSALAASAIHWHLFWRPRSSEKGTFPIHQEDTAEILDIDLWGDRLVFLGFPKSGKPGRGKPFAENGAVAWLGTLQPELEDLRPVLYDAGWKGFPDEAKRWGGAPNFYQCRQSLLGAVRFLGEGSFVIVPGFQQGVHLFNAKGERVHTWTNEQVGINTDCTGVTDEESEKLILDGSYSLEWLSGHRVVDDILPLPQGPGLLVRSIGEGGQARWELKVLTPTRVETYAVPLVGRRPADRLHGDVRNGKIALLLSAWGISWSRALEHRPGEILVAEMPMEETHGTNP